MRELKRVVVKWMRQAQKESNSNIRGVGVDVHNETARLQLRAYISVIKQINRRLKNDRSDGN